MSLLKTITVNEMQYSSITQVLEACIDMKPKEREEFLKNLAKQHRHLRDEIEVLFSSQKTQTGENDLKFLNALVQISREFSRKELGIEDPSDPFVPFEVGKYLILQELGKGGMAQVFRGKTRGAKSFEKSVAIKRILDEHIKNSQFQQLFEFEAQLSAVLHHPNIVQVFDFFSHDKGYYLVMEFLNGRNAAQVLTRLSKEKAAIPLDCALYITIESLKGLDYAHNLKDEKTGKLLEIIHRDISPKNVMLGFGGEVKLVDFGIAKAKGRMDLTQTGSFRGTVSYMSPEVIIGKRAIDARTDLFSIAAMFYELLTGHLLFNGSDIVECIDLIRKCDVSEKINALQVDSEIKRVLIKALQKEPEDRYQTAEDFLLDLQAQFVRICPTFIPKKLALIVRTLFSHDMEQDQKGLNSAEAAMEQQSQKSGKIPPTPPPTSIPTPIPTQSRSASDMGLVGGLLGFGVLSVIAGAYIYFSKMQPAAKEEIAKIEETKSVAVQEVPKAPPPPVIPEAKPVAPPVVVEKKVETKTQAPPKESHSPGVRVLARAKTDEGNANACSAILRTNPKGTSVYKGQELLGKTPFVVRLPCHEGATLNFVGENGKKLEKEIRLPEAGKIVNIEMK